MTPRSMRLAAVTALALSMGVLASCSDEFLAPPDGTACTVGTISPGDSVTGAVTGASCEVVSDYYDGGQTLAESWTLNAKAHTAYIVTLFHVADTAGFDNWKGDLFLYGRNAAGDAEWSTGVWNNFGATNLNGGANQEMVFVSSKDQVVSLRIESSSPADTGHYSLQVESCAAPVLKDSVTSAAVDVAEGCHSRVLIGGMQSRAAFWTFKGDTLTDPAVTFTRTAGDANFRSWVSGPELDVPCWTDYCSYMSVGASAGPVELSPTIYLNGTFAAFVAIPADSTATVTAGLVNTPLTAPRPPFTGPARAGRGR